MNLPSDAIAVFDSGVGGISVLRQLLRYLPRERYLYYGDSANAPYGTREPSQVLELTLRAAEQLLSRGIKALVIACNTATTVAISQLRQRYPDTIIIGIEPAVKPAADAFPGGTVGVLATPLTLAGEKYRELASRFSQSCTLLSLPAPGLAQLVEAEKANSPQAEALLRPLLQPLAGKLDALVLGCTHYPFCLPLLRRILGTDIAFFDGGEGTARETLRRLTQAGLLGSGTGEIILENSLPGTEMLSLSRRLLDQEAVYGY